MGLFDTSDKRRKSSLNSDATANSGASGSATKGGATMSHEELAGALKEQDARATSRLNGFSATDEEPVTTFRVPPRRNTGATKDGDPYDGPAPAPSFLQQTADVKAIREDLAKLSQAIEAVGKNVAAAAQKSQAAEANGQALQDAIGQLTKAIEGLSNKLNVMSGRLDTAVSKLDKVADETRNVSSTVKQLQASLPKAETFQRLNNGPAPAKERDYGAEERKRIEALDAIHKARPVVHGLWFGKKFYLDRATADTAAESVTGEKAKDGDLTTGYAYARLSDPDKPYSACCDEFGAVIDAEQAPPEAYANYVAQRKQASWTASQSAPSAVTTGTHPASQGEGKPAPTEESDQEAGQSATSTLHPPL